MPGNLTWFSYFTFKRFIYLSLLIPSTSFLFLSTACECFSISSMKLLVSGDCLWDRLRVLFSREERFDFGSEDLPMNEKLVRMKLSRERQLRPVWPTWFMKKSTFVELVVAGVFGGEVLGSPHGLAPERGVVKLDVGTDVLWIHPGVSQIKLLFIVFDLC